MSALACQSSDASDQTFIIIMKIGALFILMNVILACKGVWGEGGHYQW